MKDIVSYELGYRDGYRDAVQNNPYSPEDGPWFMGDRLSSGALAMPEGLTKKQKRRRKQSPKQKLLTKMTKKKWDRYKKGRGKKTYVEIRGEVSRSQAFKKAAKRL
tara:strand:- start:3266 stop:3583 length:318 start_codon:yes stop_codon:yes gene_type:complete